MKRIFGWEKEIKRKHLESLNSDSFNLVTIKEDKDWKDLKNYTEEFDVIADSNGSYYFGMRAAENGAKAVIFNPYRNDNNIRLLKSLKKTEVPAIVKIVADDFAPSIRNDVEKVLFEISKMMIDIQKLNDDFAFLLEEALATADVVSVLSSIYNKAILVDGDEIKRRA